jgi:hypothetical protein
MLFAEEMLQKYAARKPAGFSGGEGQMDPQAEHERELIRRAQNGDFMAYKELQMAYRNVINSAVSSANLNSVMDYNTALQEGNKAFKELIMKNFDLTKPNKPSTYIIGQLPNVLRKVKYNNRDFAGRKSEELSMHSEIVNTARNFLQKELGRDPSVDETFNFVKNNLKTGKSLTPEKIKRIDALSRSELSGNVQIGGSDSSNGADFITLSDITNIESNTPEQVYETGLRNQRVESVINRLPKIERRFIRNFYGIGEFKNKKADSLYSASVNNGMTYYEAKKVVDKFKQMLKEEGIL